MPWLALVQLRHCWDVRKSLTGFSVSFFWPATPTSKVGVAQGQGHSAKSKKRRRKRKRGRAKDSTQSVPAKPVAKQAALSPVVAHHHPDFVDTRSSSNSNSELVEDVFVVSDLGEKDELAGGVNSDSDSIERTLVEASLDAADIDVSADVYYYEVNDRPGLCVQRPNEPLNWSPVKFSRRSVKAASATSSDSEIDVSECLCIDYQRRNNEPGVEIETKDNTFWIPVAHRTHSRFRPGT